MKLYWHRGNIPGFCLGLLGIITSIRTFILGKTGGFIFHPSGLEAYLNASLFLLIGLYLVSRVLWDKIDRDFSFFEGATLFLFLIFCEIVPHIVVHYLH